MSRVLTQHAPGPGSHPPTPYRPSVVVHTCHPSDWEDGPSQPHLFSEFQASLGYLRPCLKEKNDLTQRVNSMISSHPVASMSVLLSMSFCFVEYSFSFSRISLKPGSLYFGFLNVLTRAGEVALGVKGLAAKPDSLSSILNPTWWKGRTTS